MQRISTSPVSFAPGRRCTRIRRGRLGAVSPEKARSTVGFPSVDQHTFFAFFVAVFLPFKVFLSVSSRILQRLLRSMTMAPMLRSLTSAGRAAGKALRHGCLLASASWALKLLLFSLCEVYSWVSQLQSQLCPSAPAALEPHSTMRTMVARWSPESKSFKSTFAFSSSFFRDICCIYQALLPVTRRKS